MDAFTFLKYWKPTTTRPTAGDSKPSAATITSVETTNDDNDNDNDDGPFFDLKFTVSDEDNENASSDENDDVSSDCTDEETVLNFTISSDSTSNGVSDTNLSLSPSDDLFFNGRLVPIEDSETKLKTEVSKSLTKAKRNFRVFALGFKKSKQNSTEKSEDEKQRKLFTVKFKVEEVPIMSLFTKAGKKSSEKANSEELVSSEKRFSKEVMQKYLNKVKPLYVRVSRKFGESPASEMPEKESPVKATAEVVEIPVESFKSQKQGSLPAGLRVVCKHLGKSRSASSAVVAAAPVGVVSSRRDDSLLQQEDGIQSAILHCKKSFNSAGEIEASLLGRSVSDSSGDFSKNGTD